MLGGGEMFEASTLLYIHVETPLHVGSGRNLGAVDLPIQREVTTGYPMVQASSLKGRLRAEARPPRMEAAEFKAIFGPDTADNPSEHAGALAPGDAKLLLFPVRSLAGVFAWTTSRDVLARFRRDARMVGVGVDWDLPPDGGATEALVSGNRLIGGGKVVLEEFAFDPVQSEVAGQIGRWLANHALPATEEYRYWRDALPGRFAILPNDFFRDLAQLSTEVVTRVRLNEKTKTVERGALWTEESLPVDTLLYAPVMATSTRAQNGARLEGRQVLAKVAGLGLARVQLGGDETVGRGMVYLRWGPLGGEA